MKRLLRIYVASAFANKEAVRAAQAMIRAAGHEITHDWTPEDASAYQGDPDALLRYHVKCAFDDVHGVEAADVLVALHHPAGCGLWWECGIALAHRKPIILVRSEPKPWTVFFDLPYVREVATVEEAVALLTNREVLPCVQSR